MKQPTDQAPTPGLPSASATPKRLQAAAVLLLALAIGCTALALWIGPRRSLIQGPWGLAVLPGGQVWLSVDDQLWRLDAQGQRQQQVSAAQAGLPGPAALLMPHPDGRLTAWSRNSPTLHLLTADDARPVATITPKWPADLARHGDNAIDYAFAPDGRVAIATGGGHAVALFDAQGRYLARTPADTYHFTNGLWWADGGWWSTDTNRPALVRLDTARLSETQRVKLNGQQGHWRFLGAAAASRGAAADGRKPLGAVARLANDMERGHVVDVWPDGTQGPYPVPEGQSALEPRALAWLGDTLLVVDGESFAIRRYSADRQPLADWGDATVRADLAQRHAALERWRGLYYASLAGAVALFLLGLVAALQMQRLQARAKLARCAPDLAADGKLGIPGMPMLSNRELAWRNIRAIWPVFLALAAMVAWQGALKIYFDPWVKSAPPGRWPVIALLLSIVALTTLVLLTVWWAKRRLARAYKNDELFANALALQKLARPDPFWPLCQPGEMPRETLMLHSVNRLQWLVLTNQRLLVFRGNLRDARLQRSVPRSAVRAQLVPLEQMPWWQRWLGQMTVGQCHLHLSLADGSAIAGTVLCVQAARRLAALINQTPPTPEMGDVPQETPSMRRRARWQALASLLIPGLGQWMQGRFNSGLPFFIAWLLADGLLVYAAWVAWTPSAEVLPGTLWLAGFAALAIHLTAASDAWRLRDAHRQAL